MSNYLQLRTWRLYLNISQEEMAQALETPLEIYIGWEEGTLPVSRLAISSALRLKRKDFKPGATPQVKVMTIQKRLDRIQRIRELHSQGWSQIKIAKELKISQTTVCRYV